MMRIFLQHDQRKKIAEAQLVHWKYLHVYDVIDGVLGMRHEL